MPFKVKRTGLNLENCLIEKEYLEVAMPDTQMEMLSQNGTYHCMHRNNKVGDKGEITPSKVLAESFHYNEKPKMLPKPKQKKTDIRPIT